MTQVYTREEFAKIIEEAARRRGTEGLDEFKADIARQHAAGIERGGPLCCGTTSIWHQPWCPIGPWEPEPGDQL
jgi:hypothetical protein